MSLKSMGKSSHPPGSVEEVSLVCSCLRIWVFGLLFREGGTLNLNALNESTPHSNMMMLRAAGFCGGTECSVSRMQMQACDPTLQNLDIKSLRKCRRKAACIFSPNTTSLRLVSRKYSIGSLQRGSSWRAFFIPYEQVASKLGGSEVDARREAVDWECSVSLRFRADGHGFAAECVD